MAHQSLRRCLLLGLLAVVMAGCTTASLKQLRHATPAGSQFHKALSRLYLDYAEAEADLYDWVESQYFADKGLRAAYGQNTPPERVEDWRIHPSHLTELRQARGALTTLLTPELIAAHPEPAARMQFFFDCWLEQQEEGWQQDQITACRDSFYSLMEDLQSPPGNEEEFASITSSAYIVFFEWNQAELTQEALQVLDELLADLDTQEDYALILNGHTDRSGEEGYNLELSQRRAHIVKEELVHRGIEPASIEVFAFGESDPKIATPDDVAEKANRRVEIFINE